MKDDTIFQPIHLPILPGTDCEISKATAFSICESCEVVDEISDVKLSKYLSSFNHKKGMKFKRFNLEFFGLCQKCK